MKNPQVYILFSVIKNNNFRLSNLLHDLIALTIEKMEAIDNKIPLAPVESGNSK
jgi:hypothetical protein